jgi:hypothetical protein
MRMWELGDWFSVSAWVFFTIIYAMVEYLCKSLLRSTYGEEADLVNSCHGSSYRSLPTAMKISMREGAKAMFASFFFLICLVWSLKACLIVFFLNLT